MAVRASVQRRRHEHLVAHGLDLRGARRRPILSWAATEIDPLPPDFVDDGNIPPSPFTIAQASSLTGFSFESPHPPGSVPFFVQGETKLAQVDGDASELPFEGAELRDFTEDSFRERGQRSTGAHGSSRA